jgi:hypothetical protein
MRAINRFGVSGNGAGHSLNKSIAPAGEVDDNHD